MEANLSTVTIDQCQKAPVADAFNGTNKCHGTTECLYAKGGRPFAAGNYVCLCRSGYYSADSGFDGALIEGKHIISDAYVRGRIGRIGSAPIRPAQRKLKRRFKKVLPICNSSKTAITGPRKYSIRPVTILHNLYRYKYKNI